MISVQHLGFDYLRARLTKLGKLKKLFPSEMQRNASSPSCTEFFIGPSMLRNGSDVHEVPGSDDMR